ncbi:PREDICTED: 28S ribosomal protein S6, mitochondrial isoform X2 [Thamnophis sirtalis]|uniref:Small ribosomal subunit protein bS6m n=1 Tax=Thamnophis sirtalis TaxID=35019 RepID=A0A6I9YID2_9SAUR|nr:PREDICTED: 28S ribosomal protein S6, mitochondrial isoform X2 [Thamnophis sirtalis]
MNYYDIIWPETAATLRRTVETLLERGAVVRNLENLGERMLPYKIVTHDQHHVRGGYFLVDFDSSPIIITKLLDHLKRDIDIIRSSVLRHRIEPTEECIGMIPVNYVEELQKKK